MKFSMDPVDVKVHISTLPPEVKLVVPIGYRPQDSNEYGGKKKNPLPGIKQESLKKNLRCHLLAYV
jgi:hypothetical protein